MQLIRHLTDYVPDAPLSLAIGNFDGLHRGHQAVLARMTAIAKEHGLVPAVLTFEPHPRRYFKPNESAFRLERLRDKLQGLKAAGVQRVFALPFHAGMAGLAAEDFLEHMLDAQMKVRAVVTGEGFAFGAQRRGTTELLAQWGQARGVVTAQVPPVMMDAEICSSTAIRRALAAGDMAHARALLGRPYQLSGRVQHGKKQGRELGYPTANIAPLPLLMQPRLGIYVVRVLVRGQWRPGVASLGVRPTLNPLAHPLLEVHCFDAIGQVYGEYLRVEMLQHLRDEKRFDSLDALTHEMAQDASRARHYFTEHPHG